MTKEHKVRIEELKRLVENATKGPWQVSGKYDEFVIQTKHITRDVWTICETSPATRDSKFIAASREGVPFLISVIEELEAENALLSKEFNKALNLLSKIEGKE